VASPPPFGQRSPQHGDHDVGGRSGNHAADEAPEQQRGRNAREGSQQRSLRIGLRSRPDQPITEAVLPIEDEGPSDGIGHPDARHSRRNIEPQKIRRYAGRHHLEGNGHHCPKKPRGRAGRDPVAGRTPEAGSEKTIAQQTMQPGTAEMPLTGHPLDPRTQARPPEPHHTHGTRMPPESPPARAIVSELAIVTISSTTRMS